MAKKDYRSILQSILDAEGWKPHWVDSSSAFIVSFSLNDRGVFDGFLGFIDELEQFTCYIAIEDKANASNIASVCEYICRVNYGLRLGNFEIHVDDGDVRFKNSFNFAGSELTSSLVLGVVFPALEAIYRYVPGLRAVLNGTISPLEALVLAEQSESP